MPQDVKISPDGKVFYIADMVANGLWTVDGDAFKVTGLIPTGRGAHGLYVSRDSTTMYVSNRGEGTITLFDFATAKPRGKWQIPGGGSPDMGGVSADGKVLWLSGRYNAEVYAISTTDGHLLARIPVGRGPARPSRLPATRALLAGPHRGVPLAARCGAAGHSRCQAANSSVDNPLSSAVHIRRPPPQEPDQRQPRLRRQAHRQRRRRRHRGQHRDPPATAFWTSSNEARPLTARTCSRSGRRPARRAQPRTLSTALWRPTSSRRQRRSPVGGEQGCGVEAAGFGEDLLGFAHAVREGEQDFGREFHVVLGDRPADRCVNRVDRRLPAHSARAGHIRTSAAAAPRGAPRRGRGSRPRCSGGRRRRRPVTPRRPGTRWTSSRCRPSRTSSGPGRRARRARLRRPDGRPPGRSRRRGSAW